MAAGSSSLAIGIFFSLVIQAMAHAPVRPGFDGFSGGAGSLVPSAFAHPATISAKGHLFEIHTLSLYEYTLGSETSLGVHGVGYFHGGTFWTGGVGGTVLHAFSLYRNTVIELSGGIRAGNNHLSLRMSHSFADVEFDQTYDMHLSGLYARHGEHHILFAGGTVEQVLETRNHRAYTLQGGATIREGPVGTQSAVLTYQELRNHLMVDLYQVFPFNSHVHLLCGVRSDPAMVFLGIVVQASSHSAGILQFFHGDLGWSRSAAYQYHRRE
ncbi:hypothetical protein [Chitinivibrio alkaliphilus]|uniref:Uncharacterized protein n=1 Tax=Chitinivibrio alkaliphilus ACht1 TaxID=1313304 RepID=U7D6D7_9BACT|nr:hypothetical protein [Chitinivibrio alkaliphilus]ERP31136.1 hypothetical protein CALK_2017 [Chitinivibrio alkaliphilus ACht1]